MGDYPFHVGYNWKNNQTVTLVNIPNHYEFRKTDHRRKPLSGKNFVKDYFTVISISCKSGYFVHKQ